jgi:hypothetical protein
MIARGHYSMSKTVFALLIIVAALVALSAIAPITDHEMYSGETINWRVQALAQDWVNLVLVAPLIVLAGILGFRDFLAGKLALAGALMANLYSYIIYAFFIRFGPLFPLYTAILGLTLYLLIYLLSSLSGEEIMRKFPGKRARHAVAALLTAFGALFFLVWGAQIYSDLSSGPPYPSLEKTGLAVNPVHVIDLAAFLPALIIAGVLLFRKKPLGFLLAPPLLIALFVLSVNICSIAWMFGRQNISGESGALPVFAAIGAVQLAAAAYLLKKIESNA